jgi:hypothetical protein
MTFNKDTHDVFMYATDSGFIHICDLRESSDFTNNSSLVLDVGCNNKNKSYSEFKNAVSAVQFVGNDLNKIVSRDLLTVKVWDIRNTD